MQVLLTGQCGWNYFLTKTWRSVRKYQRIFLVKSVFGDNIHLVDLHGNVNRIKLCSILISDFLKNQNSYQTQEYLFLKDRNWDFWVILTKDLGKKHVFRACWNTSRVEAVQISGGFSFQNAGTVTDKGIF